METTKKTAKFAEQITPEQLKALGVSALSNTPNRSQYGTQGLSAEELKKKFDKLVTLAIDRINSILAVLEGDKFELAERIDIGIEGIATLKDLAEAVTNGNLYNKLMDGDGSALSGVITNILTAITENTTAITENTTAINQIKGNTELSLSDLENTLYDVDRTLGFDISTLREENNEAHEEMNMRITNAEDGASAAHSLAMEAERIANGANQAVSYESYLELIDELNKESQYGKKWNVGQNIYIANIGVPDLWVRERLTSKVVYEYSGDADFVGQLDSPGYVDVGYYRLSQLETQKVDLTDYLMADDAEEWYASKVTVEDIQDQIGDLSTILTSLHEGGIE